MTHVPDDELLAYLDGELPEARRAEVAQHLAVCGVCAAKLDALRTASERLAAALARADRPAPEVGPEAVRERARLRGWRRLGEQRVLLKAAVLLLTVAGASAAAIPGSPVREWLGRSLTTAVRFFAEPPGPQTSAEPGSTSEPTTGVVVAPLDGRVRIGLVEPAPGAVVRVRLVADGEVAVWSAAARYRTGAGWIEVLDAGPGELRIELPRSLRSARIEVNGRAVVLKEGATLRLLSPADSSGSELVFRVGG